MWDEIKKYLAMFPNAVLTGIDADGYPFSVRCLPMQDEAKQGLRIAGVADGRLQPGPAGILCHSHDEKLWDLKSFQIHGKLERATDGWVFTPERFIAGQGLQGMAGQLQGLSKARADAGRYLEKRGLARPQVQWGVFQALQREVKGERR